jgi:DNA-binding Lrp family transcriptional regulator
MRLGKLQRQLCNVLQKGLPICPEPYAEMAEFLNSDEETILQEVGKLKEAGIIRRIRALINSHALGMTSTLVAVHIPEKSLGEVAKTVNKLENVSHNYLREHYYNLWFTLQGKSSEQIEIMLSNLSARFGADFHSLPVKRVFKLDVRFDAEGEGLPVGDVAQIPKSETVELNEDERGILSELQDDLEVTSRPFDFLCDEGLETEKVLRIIRGLIDKGVIRRIAAVVDHRKLGFVANILFCSEVPQDRIVEAGQALAHLAMVSHCYEREVIEDWPYNLYAMMHGKSMGEIQHVIDRFTAAEEIDSFELLPTAEELKKEPVKHRFD